jgi:sugar lactone lactonase YvrE
MSQDVQGNPLDWVFDRHVSAAGWIDEAHLLVASETDLFRLNLDTGAATTVCPMEADMPGTRSNDGRADPWGGFWVGTMSKTGVAEAGTLYRYYLGELRALAHGLSTPNAICFAPDRSAAFYADTKLRTIWRQPLDADTGWPDGDRAVHLDLSGPDERKPDGAIIDAEGCLWCAQWGSARVACYAPDGRFLSAHSVPTDHSSCPAFGGPDLTTLFVTSAREKLGDAELATQPAGQTFCIPGAGRGLPEPAVRC